MGVIDAAVAPRVAAQEPPAGEHPTPDEPELPESVDRVLRAARVVLARARRRQEPEGPAPCLNQPDPDVLHDRAAFSRTSVISPTSHSLPRASAGSASPGRAART